METILCSAIRVTKDFSGLQRASNCESGYVLFGFKESPVIEEGFLTSENRFVSSYEAYTIAEKANQLKSRNNEHLLFKKNLKT